MMKKNKSIKDVYHFMHEGISSVVTVSHDLLSLNKNCSDDDVLILLFEKLKKLDYFDSFAFYEIKNIIEFEQTYCYPESARNAIGQDVEGHINNGTFAWVLKVNRPTVFSGPVSGLNQVLFSLSTKRRINGMFVANAKGKGEINGVLVDILQLILSITVFNLDNLHLTKQLTNHTEDLEATVELRTKELKSAMTRVEQSSKFRSEFLANMSHEIRTPMNGVLGMMDLLQNTELNKKQLHYIKTAEKSGKNMLVIINDILDLSKVESGKLTLENDEFNLISLIGDLVSLFSKELQDKGIELIVSIDPDIPFYLYGGETRFWQVIINLLGNANKFTKSGEICLTLQLNNLQENEVDILVSVKDTGIGIAENSLGKIFQSFEQAELNISKNYGGTGLGLYLCERLVELMGGTIRVESALGVGSEFIFNVKMQRVFDKVNPYRFESDNCFTAVYVNKNKNSLNAARTVFESLNMHYSFSDSVNNISQLFSSANESCIKLLIIDEGLLKEGEVDIASLRKECSMENINVVCVCSESNKNNRINTIAKPFQTHTLYHYLQFLLGETDEHDINHVKEKINAKILVVEDNEVNVMVVSGMLSNMGCDFKIASNGKIALDLLKKESFDVVLMDVNMPVMNGHDATALYREYESEDERTPIVALTANVLDGDIKKYFAAGMDDCLSKPFSSSELYETLIKWAPAKNNSKFIEDKTSSNDIHEESYDFEIADLKAFDNVREILADKYDDVKCSYVKKSLELYNLISENINDIVKLVFNVHSLKGCSGALGSRKLFSICNDFELKLRKGDDSNKEHKVKEISTELKKFHAFLNQYK